MKIPLNKEEILEIAKAIAHLRRVRHRALNVLAALRTNDDIGEILNAADAVDSFKSCTDALTEIRSSLIPDIDNPPEIAYLDDEQQRIILGMREALGLELAALPAKFMDAGVVGLEGGGNVC